MPVWIKRSPVDLIKCQESLHNLNIELLSKLLPEIARVARSGFQTAGHKPRLGVDLSSSFSVASIKAFHGDWTFKTKPQKHTTCSETCGLSALSDSWFTLEDWSVFDHTHHKWHHWTVIKNTRLLGFSKVLLKGQEKILRTRRHFKIWLT